MNPRLKVSTTVALFAFFLAGVFVVGGPGASKLRGAVGTPRRRGGQGILGVQLGVSTPVSRVAFCVFFFGAKKVSAVIWGWKPP